MTTAPMITLRQLAKEIPIHHSALRRHCIKRGYLLHWAVTEESRGQSTLALTERDAVSVLTFYRKRGRMAKESPAG